ncbi:MAG: DUF1232 domain-containing protein [Fimbriimonadaceae bacterium]|nr:DUF1232 domain-containing protein [Fimbriimonadaceae bacterium]
MKNRGSFPWMSLLPVLAGLAYGASPVDLIPDVVPVLGWVDDAFVVPVSLALTAWALWRRYRRSPRRQPVPVESRTVR